MKNPVPTLKQKAVFKSVVVDGGNNISQGMRDANYAKSIVNKTTKVTNSAGWKILMEKHLSDQKLANVHGEGLNATKSFIEKGKRKKEPDYQTRHKYLETAYKITGKLKEQNNNTNVLAFILNES